MKVLLAHNFYGSSAPSGENQVFEAEANLLRHNGHQVDKVVRHSDVIRANGAWGAIQGALSTPWNPFAAKAIQRKVDEFKPDVVHVHNTFPMLSPAVFHAVNNRSARVLTLHNYRLFCPAGIPMRAGEVCTECLDRCSVVPAIHHGCYRNSRLATLPLAANVALHRFLGTWTKQVDAFIALTEFQRKRMIDAGLPADLVHVKPNFYAGNPVVVPWMERQERVVFAGRLTAEKGLLALVRAWLLWGPSAPELRIVGDGDLRDELERLAGTSPEVPIRFLGQVSAAEAQDEISRARLLVLPSICIETFGMVVVEAFALGTPAAVSDIGSFPSIVQHGQNGLVFVADEPSSLLQAVHDAWVAEGELECLSAGAKKSYEKFYTEEANYLTLMDIYEQAIDVSKRRKMKAPVAAE